MASASYHSQCGAASSSTIAIIASGIAGKSTMKAQKMNACIRPGTSRCSSLRWPSTTTASDAQALGHVVAALDARRVPHPHEPREQQGAAGEEEAGDGEGDGQRERAAIIP